MIWYQNMLLSVLELITILTLWGGLNKAVKRGRKEKVIIIGILTVINEGLTYFHLDTFAFILIFTMLLLLIIGFFKVPVKTAIFEFFCCFYSGLSNSN